MKLTETQKKWAWIVGAVLLFAHFALPGIVNTLQHAFAHSAPPAVHLKPPPGHPGPLPVAPHVATTAELEDAQFAKLVGIWEGMAIRSDSYFCQMRLELTTNSQTPGVYSGYSTRSCGTAPYVKLISPSRKAADDLARTMAPATTILSGTVENGAIHLKLDKIIRAASDGCHPTAFTLTPFGASQLATQWEEGNCLGGALNMQRVSR